MKCIYETEFKFKFSTSLDCKQKNIICKKNVLFMFLL